MPRLGHPRAAPLAVHQVPQALVLDLPKAGVHYDARVDDAGRRAAPPLAAQGRNRSADMIRNILATLPVSLTFDRRRNGWWVVAYCEPLDLIVDARSEWDAMYEMRGLVRERCTPKIEWLTCAQEAAEAYAAHLAAAGAR
jgi:hypothetical protein